MLHIRLAVDNIFSQIGRFFITVLMIAISLTLLLYFYITYEGQGYGYDECDELLSQGFKNTGNIILDIDGVELTDVYDFEKELYEENEVLALGSMEIYQGDFSSEILEIQKKSTSDVFEVGVGGFSYLVIYKSLFDLCDFKIEEGTMPKDLIFEANSESNIVTYIYLGSAYSSIPVGTEYVISNNDLENPRSHTYIVAGIVEKGQKWIRPCLRESMGNQDVNYTIDCTYGIFLVEDYQIINNELWVVPNDGCTIEEVFKVAEEIGSKYGVGITYTTLQEKYESECKDTILIMSYFLKAIEIVMPSIILLLIALQIASNMLERDTFGIMYSVGFTTTDIKIILIIKNIIASIIGLAIAALLVLWVTQVQYEKDFIVILDGIILESASLLGVIAIIAITLITSLTSVIMLKRYTPVMLMGKRN